MGIPVLVLILLLAIMAVESTNLKTAVLALGMFSMILSVVYLLESAPDVALAEAAIGSTLSTIILLVALKNYKVFHVCLNDDEFREGQDTSVLSDAELLIKLVDDYCQLKELDMHLDVRHGHLDTAISTHRYDLVIHRTDEGDILYGRARNYHAASLMAFYRNKPEAEGITWRMLLH